MIKLIVAGSRTFNDYNLLKDKLDYFLSEVDEEIEIVSGTAIGADKLGETYAFQCGYKVKKFAADWNKFGKSAGYIRNEEMAKYGTHLVLFWNGTSNGSKHMLNLAKKHGLKTRVVIF